MIRRCEDCDLLEHGDLSCAAAKTGRVHQHAAKARAEIKPTTRFDRPVPPTDAALAQAQDVRHARARHLIDQRGKTVASASSERGNELGDDGMIVTFDEREGAEA